MHGNDATEWTHEALLQDLKDAKRLFYRDVPLGSVWAGQYALSCGDAVKGTQIADLVDFKPSYTQFCMMIFEVKASRSDFLSDIRTNKWQGYLNHCHRFYFACPVGMVKRDEIPDGAGLWTRGPRGWACSVGATARKINLPLDTIMSMLFLRPRHTKRSKTLANGYERGWYRYNKYEYAARRFGHEVSRAMKLLNHDATERRAE